MGDCILKELQLKKDSVIEMMLQLKGGQRFYWLQTKKREELDRRGGILLKTAGEQNGQEGTAGTGIIIYH